MIELPEAIVLSRQIEEILYDKTVKEVIALASPHKFAWTSGDTEYYANLLVGRKVTGSTNTAGYLEVHFGTTRLIFSEGIKLTYLTPEEKLPKKHQLLVRFEDDSVLIASVQMYGGIWCSDGAMDNEYYQASIDGVNPFSDAFSLDYFRSLVMDDSLSKKSLKEVLATKQRIPGLGNGVLQDILYNAKLYPKRKMNTLGEEDITRLFQAILDTLDEMVAKGGRDTEKDLFGCFGSYKTKASKFTVTKPCPICGAIIEKKPYMGGSVYFCPGCQPEL